MRSGLLGVCATAMLVAACAGQHLLRIQDVEGQIAAALTSRAGGAYEVSCPAEVPVAASGTFTCVITESGAGTTTTVTVTQTDDQGDFSWKVADAG